MLLAIAADSRSSLSEAALARAANAALPVLAHGLQSAKPFALPATAGLLASERARDCLALAMYYEAGFEGRPGRAAVAQVVLNRMRHPAFPHSICAVVFERSADNVCQFTFACDGAMRRPRLPALWRQTLAEAQAALAGKVYAPVGMATHYHADYVFPAWAPRLEKVAVVGSHAFYRWPDGWGLRGAFTASYQGSEPALAALDGPGEANEAHARPADLATLAGALPPGRSDNEGGFVDPSKGWIPTIAGKSAPAPTMP